jgi:outer membrane protein OmpA-like peptidoglycan-associated protein
MTDFLVTCASCHRHLFSRETRCPFCTADAPEPRPPARPPAGLSRAAQLAWKVTLGGAGIAACVSPARDPASKGSDLATAPVDAGTPSTVEGPADAGTWEAEAPPPPRGIPIYGSDTIVILQYIPFPRGSDVIAKQHTPLLDAVAEVLKAQDLRLVIEGHADKSEGAAAKRLSESRARNVADELVKRGIPKTSLRTRALDATQPLDPNTPAKNRRVMFKVIRPEDTFEDAGAPLP